MTTTTTMMIQINLFSHNFHFLRRPGTGTFNFTKTPACHQKYMVGVGRKGVDKGGRWGGGPWFVLHRASPHLTSTALLTSHTSEWRAVGQLSGRYFSPWVSLPQLPGLSCAQHRWLVLWLLNSHQHTARNSVPLHPTLTHHLKCCSMFDSFTGNYALWS